MRKSVRARSDYGYNDVEGLEGAVASQRVAYSRLDWQARQAGMHGLITENDYKEAKDYSRANMLQRMLRLGVDDPATTGSTLETIGDALSVGSYLSASFAEANYAGRKEVGLGFPSLVALLSGDTSSSNEATITIPGLSPLANPGVAMSAGWDAWKGRKSYTKFAEDHEIFGKGALANFAGGFVMDVALDPTSYLTFGVAKGMKVAIGAKTAKAAQDAGRLSKLTDGGGHLSVFGTQIYKQAAKKYGRDLAASAAQRGERWTEIADQSLSQLDIDEIATLAVDNFDELKKMHLDELSSGKWNKTMMALAPAGEAARAKMSMIAEAKGLRVKGLGIDDMFEETSDRLTRGIGYDIEKTTRPLQKTLASLPGAGKLFKGMFDVFDSGWNVPPEVLEAARLTKIRKEAQFSNKVEEYTKEFGDFTKADREIVTEIVENRSTYKTTGKTVGAAMAKYTPAQERMAKFVEDEMDNIFREETEAGFALNRVENYISHMVNPAVREYYSQVIRKNGKVNGSSASQFTHQRMIASISEGDELFGENFFRKDALEILALRKKASIEMIANQAFFQEVFKKHGLAQTIVHMADKGFSKGLARSYARRAGHGIHEIITVDQVYKAEHGNLKKFGFVKGDFDGNVDRLKYLQRPNVVESGGKYSPEGEAEAARLGLTETAKMHFVEKSDGAAVAIPEFMRYRPMKLGAFDIRHGEMSGGRISLPNDLPRMPAVTALEMLGSKGHDHPMWVKLFKDDVGGVNKDFERVYGFLASLNSYTVRWLDAQLPTLVPDLHERIVEVAKANGVTDDIEPALAKVLSRFNEPIEVRRVVPQLPQQFIDLARATRRAAGILTDEAPATGPQLGRVQELAAKMGFTPSLKEQMNLQLFGEKKITTLQQADRFIDALEPLAHGMVEGRIIKDIPMPAHLRTGDDVVAFKYKSARKVVGNIDPAKDQDLGLEVAEGRLGEGADIPVEAKESVSAGNIPKEVIASETTPLVGGVQTNTGVPGKLTEKEAEAYAKAKSDFEEGRAILDELNAADVKSDTPEYDAHFKALQQARNKVSNELVTMREARAVKEAAEARRGTTPVGGGIKVDAKKVLQTETPSDRLLRLRKLRPLIGGNQREVGNAIRRLELLAQRATEAGDDASPYLEGIEFLKSGAEGSARLEAEITALGKTVALGEKPKNLTGNLRPETGDTEDVIYLPRGIADLLTEFTAPNVDPLLSETAKSMLRKFDVIQSYYKTNLLLPFTAYWGRNAMTNAATTVLKHGLSFMDPTRRQASSSAILYALDKYSDWSTTVGANLTGKIKELAQKNGDQFVAAKNGRKITIRELDNELRIRGIYNGASRMEFVDGAGGMWGKIGSAWSGTAAGGLAGGVAGTVAPGEDSDSYGMALGASMGLLLGVSGATNLGKKIGLREGGVPMKFAGGMERTIQSQWRPFMRVGEAATELPFRVHMFTQEFIDTGSMGEAANAVYRYMGDYSTLSVVERRYLRRMVPFYGWTKIALKSTATQVIENPARLASVFKAFRGWNVIHDADAEDVPDFMHGKLNAVVNATNGDQEYSIYSPGIFPVEDAAAMLSGLNPFGALTGPGGLEKEQQEFITNIVGKGAFLPLIALEIASNRDVFTSKTLDKAVGVKASDWDGAPALLKKLVGYEKGTKDWSEDKIGNPKLAWALGKIPGSRFIYVARKLQEMDDEGKRNVDTYSVARSLAGVTVIHQDPVSQQYFVNQGRIDALKNLLDHVIVESLGEVPTSSSGRGGRVSRYKRR